MWYGNGAISLHRRHSNQSRLRAGGRVVAVLSIFCLTEPSARHETLVAFAPASGSDSARVIEALQRRRQLEKGTGNCK